MSTTDPSLLSRATIVDFLLDILERRGAESYLGENVTMLEHMLQCADAAQRAGADDELVVAALLHDIGHYTNEFPEDAHEHDINNQHEQAGAAILAPFFPALVTDCVRWHVDAKRYLCATEPAYFEKLSAASVHSLRLQGGPMSTDEVADFSVCPNLVAVLAVRRWDDAAKVRDLVTAPLADYVPAIRRVVTSSI